MPPAPDFPPAAAVASPAAMLRQRAEVLQQSGLPFQDPGDGLSRQSLQTTIHELRVHQIELEMQNEELRRAQHDLAASQAMYFDFYDLAPVGYCTVNAAGLILQANLTTASLLGLPRPELMQQPITRFIDAPDQDRYYLLTQQRVVDGAPQVAELRLRKRDGSSFWARLRVVAVQDDKHGTLLRMVLTDINEFKQAQAVLQESRAELEATVKAIPDLLFEVDLAGRFFSYYSPRVDLLLLPPADFLGNLVTQTMPAPAAAVTLAALQEANHKGHSTGHQFALPLPQGEKWFELSVARKATGHERAPRFIVLSRDITERKQAEASLRVSDHALKAVSQGVLITTPDQRTIAVNDAFMSITGYGEAEVLGQNCRFLQGPLTDAQTVGALRHALQKQVEFSGEILNYRKDGSTFWNELTISPVRDKHGQLTHFIGVTRDVTERRQAETAMRIAAIAFECQEALAVMDAQHQFLRVNQAFTRITGYSQQEALGQRTQLLRPEGRHPAAFYDSVWRDINNTGVWQGEMWQRRKNGEVYPAWVSTTVVTDARGRVTHYVASLTDSTDSALQEHQREQAEATQRAALVREVHHRVKNSLQGVQGLLHQSARQHPALAVPLQQVISQVQGIAVIHGLQGRADSALVRVCELTGAIADAVASLWQTPVLVDIPHAWQPCLVVEKEAVPLALVLNELIVNAVKHGGQTPVLIDVRKGDWPHQVQISISNAGQFTHTATAPEQAHGLKLVAALLPRQGARLVREQLSERVITRLHLEPPTIGLDLKAPYDPRPVS